ncbi:glycoside hydrolase family 3 C-terminal domain-containing protein [Streptomyces zhihengii]
MKDGLVPVEAVDDKVRRLLRLAARLHALGPRRPRRAPASPSRDTRELLRRTVAAGSVLLSNRGVLPLDRAALSTVAVIGVHAATPRVQGGGSAGVFDSGTVTPLTGIRARLRGHARVVHVPGPSLDVPRSARSRPVQQPRSGQPGVLLRLLDAAGQELHAEHRLSGRQLEPPVVPGARTVEISALIRADTTGSGPSVSRASAACRSRSTTGPFWTVSSPALPTIRPSSM